MKKLARIFLIVSIIFGFLWIGARFHFLVQNVDADVFDVFNIATKPIPDFREGANYSPVGKTVINGIPFKYSVEVVNADIDEILDYYKKLYTPPYQRIFTDEQLEKAGVKEGDTAFKIIRGFEILYGKIAPPLVEYKTETTGFLGILDKGNNTDFYISKNKGKEIVPKIIMALKQNENSEKTTIIKYWTNGLFGPDKIFPKGDEDLPGFDLEDIDRHPYSQRLLSMAQSDDYSSSKITVYRVDDNLDSTIIYYVSDLRGNGWQIPESVVEALEKQKEKRFIYAKKDGRSVYITFNVGKDNYTQVVMVERYE